MGEDQGGEGKESEVASSCGFQSPKLEILACGAWLMRMTISSAPRRSSRPPL
jgi:hypothetical protein